MTKIAKQVVRWMLRRRTATLMLAGLTNQLWPKRFISAWYVPRSIRHLYAWAKFGLTSRWSRVDGKRRLDVYRRGKLAMTADFD